MSKHITDANKAKLVAFLRSRNAAGEQSLKTWGKQHKLLSHQAEDLADALVADGSRRRRPARAATSGARRTSRSTRSTSRSLTPRSPRRPLRPSRSR